MVLNQRTKQENLTPPKHVLANKNDKPHKNVAYVTRHQTHTICPGSVVGCHRPFQKRERTGTSLVVFRLFKKLRHSNERSTKFESLYQE